MCRAIRKKKQEYNYLLTGSLFPEWVQICHEYGVIYLTEKPLQHICNILNEIISNAKFHIAGILPELLHQKLDSGLGTIFPVDSFMTQT